MMRSDPKCDKFQLVVMFVTDNFFILSSMTLEPLKLTLEKEDEIMDYHKNSR